MSNWWFQKRKRLCGSGVCFQVFVCEKYLEKQNDVFVAFIVLEKAYDRMDRMAI
jgi:hypothetical protein